MAEEYKLIGSRDKVMLCRTKGLKGNFNVMLKAITEKEENDIDSTELYNVDSVTVNKGDIICYGQIDLDIDEDYDFIKNLNLIDEDGGQIPTNIDWVKGVMLKTDGHFRYSPTWDVMKWFEYNYMLIGRPERIIIYKIKYVQR